MDSLATLFASWRAEARRYAAETYCLPDDCLEDDWLRPAFDAGDAPAEAIERHAEKAGLERLADWTIAKGARALRRFRPEG